jgi:hypothetical protein
MKKDWSVPAFEAFCFLVDYVLREESYEITYTLLATKISKNRICGRLNARNMRIPLSVLGRTLANLSEPTQIPNIGCLVVNAQTHLPGDGIDEFWVGYSGFSRARKQEVFRNERDYIKSFGMTNWERVMEILDSQRMLDYYSYNHKTPIGFYMQREWF